MDHDDELAESKSKALHLIGSNVLLFQEMEHLLKKILPHATVVVSSDTDARAMVTEREEAVETCTLGTLVKRFIAEVCDPKEPELSGESAQLSIALRVHFDDPAQGDARIKNLTDLVKGRNHLIHHLISTVDVNSLESWRSVHSDLEQQQRQIRSEIESLREWIKMMEIFGAALAHPEMRREFIYGPIRYQLNEQLLAFAQESADPDGWTSLKAAINSNRFVSPASITQFLESEQVPTISAYLKAGGDFELRQDKTRKGNTQTFYRAIGTQSSIGPEPCQREA
ncbi:MAG: hypothetical protein GXX91_13290 [Verrucomicrobiaceae bacterium]|nr:hypothetical protein [Verrucomicrobiaceae bacterium]